MTVTAWVSDDAHFFEGLASLWQVSIDHAAESGDSWDFPFVDSLVLVRQANRPQVLVHEEEMVLGIVASSVDPGRLIWRAGFTSRPVLDSCLQDLD